MNSATIVVALMVISLGGCSDAAPVAISACGSPESAVFVSDDGKPLRQPSASPNPHEPGDISNRRPAGQVAEVIKQLSWQLCNARSNSWIDDDYYRRELTSLREGAFRSLDTPLRSALRRRQQCHPRSLSRGGG